MYEVDDVVAAKVESRLVVDCYVDMSVYVCTGNSKTLMIRS